MGSCLPGLETHVWFLGLHGKVACSRDTTQRTAEKKLHSGPEACKWGAFFGFLMTDCPHHWAKAAVLMRLTQQGAASSQGLPKGTQSVDQGRWRGREGWEKGDWGGGGGSLMLFIKAKPARNQSSSKVEGQDEQNKDWDLQSVKEIV